MGTKIDNSVNYLTAMRKSYQADTEMLSIAIDTMHKYQKIEQAYSTYLETMNPDTLADLISTII